MFNGFVTLNWIAIVGGCFAVLSYLVYFNTQATSIAAFHASRLTRSTFLIKEYDDIYSEQPHIYAKIIPAANTILIIDTGCGGASNNAQVKIKSLRQFIESFKIEDNQGLPLNNGGAMDYVVVLTHCHYDHICVYFVGILDLD
jgi:glyoxylase-like metal-dependent hydrolase (beta-lactamase superfamily II)